MTVVDRISPKKHRDMAHAVAAHALAFLVPEHLRRFVFELSALFLDSESEGMTEAERQRVLEELSDFLLPTDGRYGFIVDHPRFGMYLVSKIIDKLGVPGIPTSSVKKAKAPKTAVKPTAVLTPVTDPKKSAKKKEKT